MPSPTGDDSEGPVSGKPAENAETSTQVVDAEDVEVDLNAEFDTDLDMDVLRQQNNGRKRTDRATRGSGVMSEHMNRESVKEHVREYLRGKSVTKQTITANEINDKIGGPNITAGYILKDLSEEDGSVVGEKISVGSARYELHPDR